MDHANAPKTFLEMSAAFERTATMEKYGNTMGVPARQFYVGTECRPSFSFSVFVSPIVVDHIQMTSENHYHVDATFGVVPCGEFKQLWSFIWPYKITYVQ